MKTPHTTRLGATNIPRSEYLRRLALTYKAFDEVTMPSRNERNAIIFAGTMGLIRRNALVDAGGWAEWCVTEDAELSLRILGSGYTGIYVDESFGRGVMPLAVALVIDHCFTTGRLHRIEIAIRPENTNSLRVVEKLGLREIGYAPRFLHIDGDWRDHRLFAITKEEVPLGLAHRLQSATTEANSHQSQE